MDDQSKGDQRSQENHWILPAAENLVKFSFLLAFVLYAVGFLIWNLYLSKTGVFLSEIFQVAFLTSAICFVSVLGGLYLIITTFFQILGLKPDGERGHYILLAGKVALVATSTHIVNAYWTGPTVKVPPLAFIFPVSLFAIVLMTDLIKRKSAKVFLLLKGVLLAVVAVSPLPLLIMGHLHYAFFISASLFLILFVIRRQDFQAVAKKQRPLSFLDGQFFIMAVLALISFGRYQFEKIPRVAGGGAPQNAFLMLAPEAAGSINSWATSMAGTNGQLNGNCLGPVKVIFRTDQDLLFMSDAQPGELFSIRNELLHFVRYVGKPESNAKNVTEAAATNLLSNTLSNSPVIQSSVTNATTNR
jgi:hypothetical protein